MSGEEAVEQFARGQVIEVAPAAIEAELASLWRRAAEAKGGKRPMVRACTWNLVLCATSAEEFRHLSEVIDELGHRLAARTIVVGVDVPAPQAPPGSSSAPDDRVRAFVAANWREESGAMASGADEITLVASGRAAPRLPSLVRALVHPGAPTALFWPGSPGRSERLLSALVPLADRLIFDTRGVAEERDLEALYALLPKTAPPVADLAWLALAPMRSLFARLFDPPQDPKVLFHAERVRAVTGYLPAVSALLGLGWLMARLGWHDPVRMSPAPSTRRWQVQSRARQPLTLELEQSSAEHGLAGLTVWAGGQPWSLERDAYIHVHAPTVPALAQPTRSLDDAELLAVALGQMDVDAVYRAAVASAIALVAA